MGHLSVSWSNLKSSHGVSHGDVSKLGIPKLTRHCSLDMKPQDFQQRHLGTHPHDLVSHQTQKVHELVVKQQICFGSPIAVLMSNSLRCCMCRYLFFLLLIPIICYLFLIGLNQNDDTEYGIRCCEHV